MAELDLPRGPAELLEAVRKPLADHLGGEQHICLGGGTALAARWTHRHSTDVDLCTGHEAYAKLYRDSDRFSADVELHTQAVEQLGVGHRYTLIALRDGEITILATTSLTDQPVSTDIVRGTRVPLETNAEILAKKLTHRLAEYHIFVPRDLYDIAVAQRLDPEALDNALATIPPPSLDDIRNELDLLPPGWADGHRQPLLQPAYADEAADSVAIVQRVIGRHLDGRDPPAPRHSASPSHSG